MAPLKDYFMGVKKMPNNRATSSQKCIRTADIDLVGKTSRHGTFFEMLGNFSFGDYFKRDAIKWAYEFITEVIEMDTDKLWVSVYKDDDEAYNIWKDEVKFPEERIVRLGKEDNFWELEVGPCGPCSEIHIDRGEEYGCGKDDCKPGCDCDRFLEFWNLVFTQFNKTKDGEYIPLDHPNIDTGMGLERLALIVQGKENIFEIDVNDKIIKTIENLSHKKYGEDKKIDSSIRVITDHIKALMFLIADGVIPSNEARGYVLRRIMRRAIRHGRLIGIDGEFLTKVGETVIESYKNAYPVLERDKERIFKIIYAEEEKFQETIMAGLQKLNNLLANLKNGDILDGEEVFKLYDTYGFPIDLTREIADEKNINVDENAFKELMNKQKLRSKASRTSSGGFSNTGINIEFNSKSTEFLGYTELKSEGCVTELFVDEDRKNKVSEGEFILVADRTPFYGEGGGQVGDTGFIYGDNLKIKVIDTKKNADGIIYHICEIVEGTVEINDKLTFEVDRIRRHQIAKNHSSTHLLNKALKEVLGPHINQAGSLVDDKRLRFDFTHFEAIKKEDLEKIEELVNSYIDMNLPIETSQMDLKEANKIGAIGLFEDKYKDIVRVVKMGDVSMELCGGTHLSRTSEVGMFSIQKEEGIAAGVRRIEAITGREFYKNFKMLEKTIEDTAIELKTNQNDLSKRAKTVMIDLREKEKEIEKLRLSSTDSDIEKAISEAKDFDGGKLVTFKFDGLDMNTLRSLTDKIKDKIGDGVVVLASTNGKSIQFTAGVSKSFIKKGVKAGNIIREVAKLTGGGGGGRDDFASAGGKDISKLDDALKKVKDLI